MHFLRYIFNKTQNAERTYLSKWKVETDWNFFTSPLLTHCFLPPGQGGAINMSGSEPEFGLPKNWDKIPAEERKQLQKPLIFPNHEKLFRRFTLGATIGNFDILNHSILK